MALFSAADLLKHGFVYPKGVISHIKDKQKIKTKDGTFLFEMTPELVKFYKRLNGNISESDVTKFFKTGNKYNLVFKTKSGDAVGWSKIDKSVFSGVGNRNALGKKLADAGELATVMSLTTNIKTAEDTKQKLFIDNPIAFEDWLLTFEYTKIAVQKVVGNLSAFEILHDATDHGNFAKVITAFTKKIKIPKDSWNPADIFVIKKSAKNDIVKELGDIVDNYEIKDGLIDLFNNAIYKFYIEKTLYPISLKQLITNQPKIDLTNIPGKNQIKHYDITIERLNCNLSLEGKEIGLFVFKNNDTNKNISMQVRGFPHGYGTSQTEITSDGSKTGGRLGKVSTNVIDRLLAEYNFERIKKISYFGSPKYFSKFDDKLVKEVYSWYKDVIKYTNTVNLNKVTLKEFREMVSLAKGDSLLASNLCHKIQGLKMMKFYVDNHKEVATIMNKMINGAKKISSDNGFFIKIY